MGCRIRQNPSGITSPNDRCRVLASVINNISSLFVEDYACGELNVSGKNLLSMREFLPVAAQQVVGIITGTGYDDGGGRPSAGFS